jgi:hypothetical protein
MFQQLPAFPNLDHLKKQAKDVLRVSRSRHPNWCLADAQHALARGYGFPSWPKLKLHVASVRRAAATTPAADDAPKPASHNGRHPSAHPIVGTWSARESVMEIELADDLLILTQIAADSSGIESATKMAIQTDGLDHRVPFDGDLVLQTRWAADRTLEMIAKRGEQVVGTGTYEVSADGQSLVVSNADRVLVFTRA